MGKKKAVRLCSSCGYRHGTPTGRNCPLAESNNSGFVPGVRQISAANGLDKPLPEPHRSRSTSSDSSHSAGVRRQQLDDMQKAFSTRMDKLENLFIKSLDRKKRDVDITDSEFTDLDSSSEDDSPDRRSRRKRKHKKLFDQKRFLDEGEDLKSFEALMLLSTRHVLYMLEHGVDPKELVHHMKFMASKAVLGHYKADAFISYDRVVRDRANREGVSAFANVLQEDVVLHFSPENMVPKPGKPSMKKSEPQKKKTGGYCRNFNDGDCAYPRCIFLHRCMACEDPSHGRKQCPSLKKSK